MIFILPIGYSMKSVPIIKPIKQVIQGKLSITTINTINFVIPVPTCVLKKSMALIVVIDKLPISVMAIYELIWLKYKIKSNLIHHITCIYQQTIKSTITILEINMIFTYRNGRNCILIRGINYGAQFNFNQCKKIDIINTIFQE